MGGRRWKQPSQNANRDSLEVWERGERFLGDHSKPRRRLPVPDLSQLLCIDRRLLPEDSAPLHRIPEFPLGGRNTGTYVTEGTLPKGEQQVPLFRNVGSLWIAD